MLCAAEIHFFGWSVPFSSSTVDEIIPFRASSTGAPRRARGALLLARSPCRVRVAARGADEGGDEVRAQVPGGHRGDAPARGRPGARPTEARRMFHAARPRLSAGRRNPPPPASPRAARDAPRLLPGHLTPSSRPPRPPPPPHLKVPPLSSRADRPHVTLPPPPPRASVPVLQDAEEMPQEHPLPPPRPPGGGSDSTPSPRARFAARASSPSRSATSSRRSTRSSRSSTASSWTRRRIS